MSLSRWQTHWQISDTYHNYFHKRMQPKKGSENVTVYTYPICATVSKNWGTCTWRCKCSKTEMEYTMKEYQTHQPLSPVVTKSWYQLFILTNAGARFNNQRSPASLCYTQHVSVHVWQKNILLYHSSDQSSPRAHSLTLTATTHIFSLSHAY